MTFYDRYNGKMTTELPNRMDLGRFTVVDNDVIRDITNIDVVKLGDYIVRETLFEETNQNVHDLLRTIAISFEKNFANVTPIIQKFNIEIKKFEELLNDKKSHLKAIVANPHSLLDKNTMKVNIGRAKRISTRSYQYLSHHSEDWERITMLSPKPRKILHEELIVDYAVYENILLKIFLHEAIKHLSKRIKETADITKFFLSIFDEKEFKNVWEDKINRSNALVGRAKKKDKSKDSDTTNRTLSSIKAELIKLENSPLFEEFPKSVSSVTYHDTNVLNSHKHYKFLKILWLELQKTKEQNEVEDPIIVHQEIMNNMRLYVCSLFVYSLVQMGYKVNKRQRIIQAVHDSLPLITLVFDKYGVLSISTPTKTNEIKVVTLGGVYDRNSIVLPTNTICFCFRDFQQTDNDKESVNGFYFINPIDTNSIECSGSILRKMILNEYSILVKQKIKFKQSLRDFVCAIDSKYIHFDEKSFTYSFDEELPFDIDEKKIISTLDEMPAFKKRNKTEKRELLKDMTELITDIVHHRTFIKERLVCPKCGRQYRTNNINYLVCDKCDFICDLSNDEVKFHHQHKKDYYSNITKKGWGMDFIE